MKTYQILYILGVALSITFACNKKTSENADSSISNASDPKQMIYGNGEKSWKATRETTATGEKDELTKEEKKEVVVFNSNGNFTMSGNGESMQGTWTYDAAAKNLSLRFAKSDVTENFSVLNLSDSEMKLKAGDGSTLTLNDE